MDHQYNFYNLEASFKNFLLAGKKLESVTIKNYLSDLRHFLGWLIFKFKVQTSKSKINEGIDNISRLISSDLINEYRSYLLENEIPERTVKRRLSTLSKFCSFCISQGWLKENPMKKVRNDMEQILARYKKISSLDDYNNVNDFINFINPHSIGINS